MMNFVESAARVILHHQIKNEVATVRKCRAMIYDITVPGTVWYFFTPYAIYIHAENVKKNYNHSGYYWMCNLLYIILVRGKSPKRPKKFLYPRDLIKTVLFPMAYFYDSVLFSDRVYSMKEHTIIPRFHRISWHLLCFQSRHCQPLS